MLKGILSAHKYKLMTQVSYNWSFSVYINMMV
jgi:hypothetical protein